MPTASTSVSAANKPVTSGQTGLLCLEVVARVNHINIDMRGITRSYGLTNAEILPEELLRIAQQNGFKATLKKLDALKLTTHYPLPAIGLYPDGSYTVLLKLNTQEKKGLCFNAVTREAEEVDLVSLPPKWLVLVPKVAAGGNVRFGFSWFYQEILTYRRVITEVLLGSFVVQLFALVTPLFTQVILDKVIVHESLTTLDVIAVAFVGILVFELLLNLSRNYIFTHTANKIDAKLGAKLFKQLFSLPFTYFENRKVGTIISRIREMETIRQFITNKSVSVIIDLLFSLVFVAMMALYSVPLTALVVGFVFLISLLYFIITPQFRARLDEKFQMSAQSNAYMVEAVSGIQTVKSLAIEGTLQKRWEDLLGNYLRSSFNLSLLSNMANALSTALQRLMTLAILYFGVRQVLAHQLSIGQLIAFNMFANQFTAPVIRLTTLWNEFQQTLLGVDQLGDILNQPSEVQSANAITLPQLKGNIHFQDIHFRYTVNGPVILSDFNLNIPAGCSIGLVGRSGSGKSTLTKLIQRLYLPTSGLITIDGVDIRHLNPLWLRYQIGVVLQDNYLFSGSIRENISLPRPEAAMEQIIQVAQLAGAHPFITQLPEGYDTMVGERGSTLSGGQRQRIAIARALITQPKILVFDEATSALDSESEREITQNMKQLKANRTVVIVAHRLKTVKDCDQILALDKGRILEIGSHESLIAQKGYYYSLYQQQQDAEESVALVP